MTDRPAIPLHASAVSKKKVENMSAVSGLQSPWVHDTVYARQHFVREQSLPSSTPSSPSRFPSRFPVKTQETHHYRDCLPARRLENCLPVRRGAPATRRVPVQSVQSGGSSRRVRLPAARPAVARSGSPILRWWAWCALPDCRPASSIGEKASACRTQRSAQGAAPLSF